jgi:hypothetical protein
VSFIGPDGRERLRYGFGQLGDPTAVAQDLKRVLHGGSGGVYAERVVCQRSVFGAAGVAVVVLASLGLRDSLFTPYLDVVCRWNVPPLVDKRWAGLVMFVSGVPQIVATWLLDGPVQRDEPPIERV